MPRPLSTRTIAIIAIAAAILLSLLLLPACCCVRGPANPALAPVTHIPPIGSEAIADFSEAQTKAATLLKTSQSRLARMEAGDPSVSLDLLVRGLFALGATREELAEAV